MNDQEVFKRSPAYRNKPDSNMRTRYLQDKNVFTEFKFEIMEQKNLKIWHPWVPSSSEDVFDLCDHFQIVCHEIYAPLTPLAFSIINLNDRDCLHRATKNAIKIPSLATEFLNREMIALMKLI